MHLTSTRAPELKHSLSTPPILGIYHLIIRGRKHPIYPSSHPRIPYKTPCQRRIEDACGLVSLAGGALLLANQVRQLGHLIENRLSLGHLCAHLTHRVHHGRVVAAA